MGKFTIEERYCSALRHTGVVMFRIDRDLKYTWIFNLVSKEEAAHLIGKTDEELFAVEEAEPLIRAKRIAFALGETQKLSGIPLTLHGETRYFDMAITPELNPLTGEVAELSMAGTDVTGQWQLHEVRERCSRLESLGLLAGGIAHDFNNFLAGLAASISLAQTDAQISLRSHEYLQGALDAAFSAQQLTRQLLAFTKGGTLMKHACNMQELLEDATHFALRGSSVAARFEIDPQLWTVEADAGQIRQVIHNIVLNARQAMSKGGTIRVIAVNTREEESAEAEPAAPLLKGGGGQSVAITIQDTGSGIPAEAKDKIFHPYFTTKSTGTGLGLATSLAIAQRHGGTLTFASTVGEGTAFTLKLPALPGLKVAEAELATGEMRGSGRVLVMDDNDLVRKLVTEFLQNAGYDVVEASDGDTCLALVAERAARGEFFDAYLLDLTIPGGRGGVETLRELQKIHPSARAVATSGYAEEEPMIHFARHGFCDVLAKPFRFEVLAATLDRAMAPGGCAPGSKPGGEAKGKEEQGQREVSSQQPQPPSPSHLHDVSL
ncbi:MAG: ATP-binding protein [Candidatus Methylacidiphilales bacterium]